VLLSGGRVLRRGYGALMARRAKQDIPRTLEALTPAWLDRSLRAGGVVSGPAITGFEIEKLGEGEGFMGETARLHLARAAGAGPEAGPRTVIVKIPTAVRRLRGAGESLGIYEREILFYQDLARDFPVRVPRCYFAAMDPRPFGGPENDLANVALLEKVPHWLLSLLIWLGPLIALFSRRRYVLILEDLAPARLGDQVSFTPRADIEGAVDSLALMHARFWNDAAAAGRAWINPSDVGASLSGFLVKRQRKRFLSMFRESLPADIEARLDWLQHNMTPVQTEMADPPCTLLHGDYRLDNLFFDDGDPTARAIVSDWQVPNWGRGVMDLAYFLSGTLEANSPAGSDRVFVERYHAALVAHGVTGYPLEMCLADYERALLVALLRVVTTFAEIEHQNPRARELFRLWVERVFALVPATGPTP